MVIESGDEDVSDKEIDDQDPWETLRQEVEESLSSTYDKKANKFLKEGISETIAEAKAFNALLPVYRRKLRGLYLHYLQWFERLKHDPVHKDVMKPGIVSWRRIRWMLKRLQMQLWRDGNFY